MASIPNGILVSDVSITQNIPVYRTTSSSQIDRVRDRGIHYLTGSMTLTSDNPRLLDAFLLEIKCAVEPFIIDLGGRRFNPDRMSGQPSTTTDYQKGANKLQLSGFFNRIVEGDMFTFPNQTKVYYVKVGGFASDTIEIYPPLRESIVQNEKLDFTNVQITARLDDSSNTVTYDEGGLIASIDINWKEVL